MKNILCFFFIHILYKIRITKGIDTVLVARVRDVESTRSYCSRVSYRNPRVHIGDFTVHGVAVEKELKKGVNAGWHSFKCRPITASYSRSSSRAGITLGIINSILSLRLTQIKKKKCLKEKNIFQKEY